MVARLKATKAQKRWKREARAKEYEAMAVAASEIVMQNRGDQYRTGNPEYVLSRFPHWVKFAKTFPKGYIVDKDTETNTYKINATKLLDWLYENGHNSYNASMLVQQTKHYEVIAKAIDRMFDIEGE